MSEIRLTAAQRRQMKRLGVHVDEVTDGDRVFFEQHPQRRHRIRHSHACEIAQNEIVEGKPWTPPPGWRWFTIVRNVASGVRARLYTVYYEDAPTDVDEATAREIYEYLETPRTRELEAQLLKAKGTQS
jgi:hypothetical protein